MIFMMKDCETERENTGCELVNSEVGATVTMSKSYHMRHLQEQYNKQNISHDKKNEE